MRHAIDQKLELKIAHFLGVELPEIAKGKSDHEWSLKIQPRLAEIGHSCGFLVFARKDHCPTADHPEWLYDHHWRVKGDATPLVRIPLAMEIEWGFGAKTIVEKVTEDFLKLVQCRADLRVMVFQCGGAASMTDRLIEMAEAFEGTQQGDRWLFAGWCWGTDKMHCRLWTA